MTTRVFALKKHTVLKKKKKKHTVLKKQNPKCPFTKIPQITVYFYSLTGMNVFSEKEEVWDFNK